LIAEEQNIIQRLREEPNRTLKWIYDSYYSYVCSVVYKMVNDSVIAEDIAQEVFFEIWKKREQIELNVAFRPYIRRAAVNRTLNHLRGKKIVFEEQESALEISNDQYTTLDHLQAGELQETINKTIENLPDKCRVVFALSRFESLSYQEIANQLDISKKTVENQISKAIKILRSAVSVVEEKDI